VDNFKGDFLNVSIFFFLHPQITYFLIVVSRAKLSCPSKP